MVSQFAMVVAMAQAPGAALAADPGENLIAPHAHRELRVSGAGVLTVREVASNGVCVEFVTCANAFAEPTPTTTSASETEIEAVSDTSSGSPAEAGPEDEPEILFLTSAQIAALEAAHAEAEAQAATTEATASEEAAMPSLDGEPIADQALLVDEDDQPGTGSDIVVTGELEAPKGDPAEAINAATFDVVQDIDKAVVEPIANVYEDALPKPARAGLKNFLSNLGEPVNAINFLLQLKPGKALKSVGRFAVNTTVGIGGLFDPAEKQLKMKHETNGFANTLGYYGVGPGPYLYLPFIGSTTVRDLGGRILDISFLPAVVGKPFNDPRYTIPVGTLVSLESRIEIDDQIDAIREKCGDPYSATRDIYLVQRQLEIDGLKGRESRKVGELVERLEFNCDITVLTSGGELGQDAAEFVKNRTTLVEGEGEAELDPGGIAEDEVQDAAPLEDDLSVGAEEPEPSAASGVPSADAEAHEPTSADIAEDAETTVIPNSGTTP